MFFEDLSKKDVYLNLVSFFIGLTMLSMMLTTPTEVRAVLFSMSILGLIFLKGSIDLLKQMLTKYYIYLIFVLICFISYFLNFDSKFSYLNYPKIIFPAKCTIKILNCLSCSAFQKIIKSTTKSQPVNLFIKLKSSNDYR